jgi:hypothetical protein
MGCALLCAGSLLAVWTILLALTGWYPTEVDRRTLPPAEIDSAIDAFRTRCYVATIVSAVTILVGAALCFRWRCLPDVV